MRMRRKIMRSELEVQMRGKAVRSGLEDADAQKSGAV